MGVGVSHQSAIESQLRQIISEQLDEGTFFVRMEVTDGICTEYAYDTVRTTSGVVADFNCAPGNPVMAGDEVSFTDQSTGNVATWLWDFGNGDSSDVQNPSYTYIKPDTYTVWLTVAAPGGCTDSISKTVIVESETVIPDFFSPNGDGTNDEFRITGFLWYDIEIYDRWGTRLWMNNGVIDDFWNGQIEGLDAADGVYYYIFEGESYKGEYFKRASHLTLMR